MFSSKEAVETLLVPVQEGNVCKATPRAIQHNVIFLLDKTHLKHEDDIKSDDMGTWRNNGVRMQKFAMDPEGEVYQLDDDEMPPAEWMIYNLKRLYFKNKSSPDLKKYFFLLQGMYNKITTRAVRVMFITQLIRISLFQTN